MRYLFILSFLLFSQYSNAACDYSLHPNGCVLEIKCDSSTVSYSLDLVSITWAEYSDDDINLKDYSGNKFSSDIDDIDGFVSTSDLIDYIKTQRIVCASSGAAQNLVQVNDSTFYITETNDTIVIGGVSGGGSPQSLVLGAKDDTSQALGISGGNSILIDVRDVDYDVTNELQNLTQIDDSSFAISGTNDTIIIRSSSGTDNQIISISNDTIYLEDGGFVVLPSSSASFFDLSEGATLSSGDTIIGHSPYLNYEGSREEGDLVVTMGDYDDSSLEFKVSVNIEDGMLIVTEDGSQMVTTSVDNITFSDGSNEASIMGSNITQGVSLELPDTSGTFAMSVNGNMADSKGNIDLDVIDSSYVDSLITLNSFGGIYDQSENKTLSDGDTIIGHSPYLSYSGSAADGDLVVDIGDYNGDFEGLTLSYDYASGIIYIKEDVSSDTLILRPSNIRFVTNGHSYAINSSYISKNSEIQLPDTSGTLAMSVNGVFADTKGNIEVSTGGTVDSINFCGYGYAPFYGREINDTILNGWVNLSSLSGGTINWRYINGALDCANATSNFGFVSDLKNESVGVVNDIDSLFGLSISMADGLLELKSTDKDADEKAAELTIEDSTLTINAASVIFDVPSKGANKVWADTVGEGEGLWVGLSSLTEGKEFFRGVNNTTLTEPIAINDTIMSLFKNYNSGIEQSDKFSYLDSVVTFNGLEEKNFQITVNATFTCDSSDVNVAAFIGWDDDSGSIVDSPLKSATNTGAIGNYSNISISTTRTMSAVSDTDLRLWFYCLDSGVSATITPLSVNVTISEI